MMTRTRLSALLRDTSGQGTVEYVLIIGLIVVVLLNLLILTRGLLAGVIEQVKTNLESWAQEDISPAEVHQGKLPKCGRPLSPPACDP